MNLLLPSKKHLLVILYCAKEMRLLKALPNEEFLSQDNDFCPIHPGEPHYPALLTPGGSLKCKLETQKVINFRVSRPGK